MKAGVNEADTPRQVGDKQTRSGIPEVVGTRKNRKKINTVSIVFCNRKQNFFSVEKLTVKLTVACDNILFMATLMQCFHFILAKGLFRDLSAWLSFSLLVLVEKLFIFLTVLSRSTSCNDWWIL